MALAIYTLSYYNSHRDPLDPDANHILANGALNTKSPLGRYAITASSIIRTLACGQSDLEWASRLVERLSTEGRRLVIHGRIGSRIIDSMAMEKGYTDYILALATSIGGVEEALDIYLEGPQQHPSPLSDIAPLWELHSIRLRTRSPIEDLASCTAYRPGFNLEISESGVHGYPVSMEPRSGEWSPKITYRRGIVISRRRTLVELIAKGIIDPSYYGGAISLAGDLALYKYDSSLDELSLIHVKTPKSGFEAVIAGRRDCSVRKKPLTEREAKRIIYNGISMCKTLR